LRRLNLDHSDKGARGERVRFTLNMIDEMRLSDVNKFSIVTERRKQREE
jgi:hypothetical protein